MLSVQQMCRANKAPHVTNTVWQSKLVFPRRPVATCSAKPCMYPHAGLLPCAMPNHACPPAQACCHAQRH